MIGKIAVWLLLSASLAAAEAPSAPSYEVCDLQGWAVHVRSELLTPEKKTLTEARLSLVAQQLVEIVRVVPAAAVTELRKIPLWISPPLPQDSATRRIPSRGRLAQEKRPRPRHGQGRRVHQLRYSRQRSITDADAGLARARPRLPRPRPRGQSAGHQGLLRARGSQ